MYTYIIHRHGRVCVCVNAAVCIHHQRYNIECNNNISSLVVIYCRIFPTQLQELQELKYILYTHTREHAIARTSQTNQCEILNRAMFKYWMYTIL